MNQPINKTDSYSLHGTVATTWTSAQLGSCSYWINLAGDLKPVGYKILRAYFTFSEKE